MKPAALSLLLLVPLAWGSFAGAQSMPQSTSSAPQWRQSQETNVADSYAFTRFTLLGKFSTSQHNEASDRPALTVDCIPATAASHRSGKFVAANLLVGTPLKIVYVEPEEIHGMSYYPKVAVRYRTDAKEAERDKWSPGTDKTSAAIPKDALKKILRAHAVAITANDERGTKLTMQFDLPDPVSVEQACNVDER